MPSKLPKIISIPALLIALTWLSFLLVKGDNQPVSDQYFFGSKNRPFPIFKKENRIDPLIKNEVQILPGRYAIYIKDLKTNNIYGANFDEKFPSASLYKLAVMYKTYDSLKGGELKKDELLSAEKIVLDTTLEGKHVNEATDNSSDEVISYTVENALKIMITISDNYSAILLTERLGWQNIDKFMEKENLSGINLVGDESPTVTAESVGGLLESIYRNKAVSHLASEEMKNLLFAQTVNNRIPKYLPRRIKIGHKTGELDSLRHDVGIVLGKRGDYIFVFLSETPVPEDASENIARLSGKIFEELEE